MPVSPRGDAAPTQVWIGSKPAARILYFSTLARFRWWLSLARTDYEAPQDIAAVAHGGLPARRELELLHFLRKPRRAKVTVFGDLDPDDLQVYASLSSALGPKAVDFDGVTSRLVSLGQRVLGTEAVQRMARPFDRREAALLRSLSRLDLPRLVGPESVAILEAGRRLELEAILPALLAIPRARRTLVHWVR